jgi:hypothetical protein
MTANSKMTTPRVEAALNGLRSGYTRTAAAAAAGVTRMTFYRWMDDDTFRDEVEKAEGMAEAAYTTAVANAVPRSWQAAAWWLERRRYQDYARRDQLEVKMDLRAEVVKLATELGLDPDTAVAEAESILAAHR